MNLRAEQELVPHALGEQKVAVVVAGIPGIPVSTSMADLRDIFFSSSNPSLVTYFREVSYGKTWITGDVFGPYSLTRTYGWDNNEWNEALADALKQAGSSLDLRGYNHLILIYPVQGLANAWAGNAGHGCVVEGYCPSDGTVRVLFLGASTGPTPREKVYAVALHEFLHALGSPHADVLDYAPETLGIPDTAYAGVNLENDPAIEAQTVDGGAFRNAADLMSAPMGGTTQCSNVIAAHLSAPLKYHLGWLDKGGNLAEVDQNGSYQLKPLETTASGLQALRVRRVPGTDLWLWIEFRQPSGLDQALSPCTPQVFTGATIYYEMPPQNDSVSAVPLCPLGGRLCGMVGLLDFTPETTPHDFRDSALAAGKTWSDPLGQLTIRVSAATSEGLPVTISYDTPCATFTPASRAHPRQSDTGTIQVNAPAGCAWTAATYKSADWLSLTAAKGGTGPGAVSYAAAENGTHLRTGWIVIARQPFVVTQDYERVPPVGERSDPNSGRYAVGQTSDPGFDFYYIDKNGGQDIRKAYALFADSLDPRNACEIEYDVLTRRFRVSDDSGAGWTDWSWQFGDTGWPNPQNSQCIVRFAAPAGPGGDEFYTSFHLSFKVLFVGAKNIYLRAADADGMESPWVQVGTWTIYSNHPPVPISVSPDSGSGAAQAFQLVYRDPDGAIDFKSVQASIGATTGRPHCYVAYLPSTSRVYLESDTGSWLAPVAAGSRAMLQNQSCAIDVSGISATAADTDMTLTLPVIFNSGFAGTKNVYGYTTDTVGATSSFTKLGTWTVPQVSCSFSFEPAEIAVAANETKNSVSIKTTPGCSWVVSSTVSWINITSALGGSGDGTVSFTVLTNPLAVARTGSITVGGASVQIAQDGRSTALNPPLADMFYNSASFAQLRAFPTATWITITGANLAPLTRTWGLSDFDGNKLPTRLDGVSVDINGKPAYIFYISPTQLNVLTPDDDGQAAWNLRVTTPAGSEPYTHGLLKTSYSPAFFMFDPEGRKYIAAVHLNGALSAKPGLYAGASSLPAKPGETIMLYATGFGPTQPACPAGQTVSGPAPVSSQVTVRVANQPAVVQFAGLVSPGLYQINLVVPSTTPDGDQLVVAQVAGSQTQANAYLTIQR